MHRRNRTQADAKNFRCTADEGKSAFERGTSPQDLAGIHFGGQLDGRRNQKTQIIEKDVLTPPS